MPLENVHHSGRDAKGTYMNLVERVRDINDRNYLATVYDVF